MDAVTGIEMNDWRVSGSESDSDLAEDDAVDIGGIKMSSEKIRDMLKMVEKRKTLELDAVTGQARSQGGANGCNW